MKRTLSVLAASAIIITATSISHAAPSAKQQAVYSASASFIKEYKLDKSELAPPLLYDLNNDGKDEVILTTAKYEITDSDLYIGVYSLANGKKITVRHDQDTNGIPAQIRRVKNKTYKNCIALSTHGTTGFEAFGVEVLTLRNNKLTNVASFEAEGEGENNFVIDLNKDGYHEFAALEVESGIGADRLGFSGAANNITFRWDEAKKKYIQYGPDGIREDQRKPVGTLTTKQALDILIEAYKVEMSFDKPQSLKKIEAAMKPYFSHNFIYEFQGSLRPSSNGYSPTYMETDDFSSLMPSYNTKQKLTLKFNSDKTIAISSQNVEVQGEEGFVSTTAITTLVKTKYGWRIDSFDY
ncbi:hypothetical protein G5B47_13285 [Paenibacillus sp. 7124]|uniref:DUF4829 domain-containing protein n=2 Tax=Paenibacillus apii TaxID=1850370 RepID=A0A6M1PJK0_9BACL|nr:hypothetical protein [Paenibacillus apii]